MLAMKLSFFIALFALPKIFGQNYESDEHNVDPSLGSTWNYSNANNWSRDWSACGGKRQSPIDIDIDNTVVMINKAANLVFVGYENLPLSMKIVNNGGAVHMKVVYKDNEAPFVRSALLKGDYIFLQLHFHWGPNDKVGSEHTLQGEHFPLEMHMVHYKKEYGNIETAFKHSDGVVMVSYLIQKAEKDNPGCRKFEDDLGKVTEVGSEIDIEPFPLTDFNFDRKENYFTYPGSLTAPPCSEIVTWIFPSTHFYVSENQLEKFRAIKFISGDDTNVRPLQPLNGREVIFYPYVENDGSGNP